MAHDENAAVSARLGREIIEINRTIAELIQRRQALESTVLKFKGEDLAAREVTRKNSINRILVEKSILEQLTRDRFVPSRKLFIEAKANFYFLNSNTFRSYVRRMKERDLIESNGNGAWRLAPPPKEKTKKEPEKITE